MLMPSPTRSTGRNSNRRHSNSPRIIKIMISTMISVLAWWFCCCWVSSLSSNIVIAVDPRRGVDINSRSHGDSDSDRIISDSIIDYIAPTSLDCGMRHLALKYATSIITGFEKTTKTKTKTKTRKKDIKKKKKESDILGHVFDALELSTRCGSNKETTLSDLFMINDTAVNSHEPPPPSIPTKMTTSPSTTARNSRKHRRAANLLRREASSIGQKNNLQSDDDHDRESEFCNPDNPSIYCVFVRPKISSETLNEDNFEEDKEIGTVARPFSSIHTALDTIRSIAASTNSNSNEDSHTDTHSAIEQFNIILRNGTHYIDGKPIDLSGWNNNNNSNNTSSSHTKLQIQAFPNETVWISGGMKLDNSKSLFKPVTKLNHDDGVDVGGTWVANLTEMLTTYYKPGKVELPKIVSLFTSQRRYIRARYPNADPEIAQWGYSSPLRRQYSLSTSENVHEWIRPPPGEIPAFTFFDFSSPSSNVPTDVPIKNDSAQPGYNWYASGHGGVCSDVWGDEADSYWCSNASQGGWSEVDRECAMTGHMQLPIGMKYNRTASALVPLYNASLTGSFIHAWHSQSWAVHMFEVTAQNEQLGKLSFAKGGGRQGGRNWCRCDQCTYAGAWCGQHKTPPHDGDDRLIGGDWYIENALHFLDQPGEYFFDHHTNQLYVRPNSTDDLADFHLGLMTELVNMRGVNHAMIKDIGFRDMAATYMDDGWAAPSGGDWSLRRGGAIFIENSSDITISGCHFFRLDTNAIFLSRRTRCVGIENNIFEWLGENGIATWGETKDYDGASETFPMFTKIQYNVFRELGIYQKQSSAVGMCKAALTTIEHNLMFNMGRAAINFNDNLGGGDLVSNNLLFNTCRESGDHGPINSWDRQAFLTTLKDGHTKSFEPLPRVIRNNFIIANYGASEAVDNDDGSSWFHIHHNLFYDSYGFKMDYGGHDSVYEDNLSIALPAGRSQCFGMGGFFEGHSDILRRNRCVVGLGQAPRHIIQTGLVEEQEEDDVGDVIGTLWGGCEEPSSAARLSFNQYYTPTGSASIQCDGDSKYTLEQVQDEFGLELNSTVSILPEIKTILDWAEDLLHGNEMIPNDEGMHATTEYA